MEDAVTAPILSDYVQALPIPPRARESAPAGEAPGIRALPDGVVAGSAMLAFDGGLEAELRAPVALSLLAAQRVADADPVVRSPADWVARHDMVLRGLNWTTASGGSVFSEAIDTRLALSRAVLPYLDAAFGGAQAGGLIRAALEQLAEGGDGPWFALLDRESRRFDVSEYRFATAEAQGGTVVLRMAAARMRLTETRTQVLVFRFGGVDISFRTARATLSADAGLLAAMTSDLEAKLRSETCAFIRALPL
jgi:hypothetical protein